MCLRRRPKEASTITAPTMTRQQSRAEFRRQQFDLVKSKHGEPVTLRYQHILLPRRLRRQAVKYGAAKRLAHYIKLGRYDG